MSEQRLIMHLDMDAFFAAVEQRDRPELAGKAVIVGADPQGGKGRGVVSTCSYEARKFGVHSAMPIQTAYKLCPHGIYVPPNGRLYSRVSANIFKILHEFTDLVEPLSIDEAFMDVTGSVRLFGGARQIAYKMKERIRQEENLTASIGIAPNKYLAKIASDLEKPDGLVEVQADKIDQFLAPLSVERLWGAGKQTQKLLHTMGIHTIGDLMRFPENVLEKKMGKMGRHFYNLAHGIDERAVQTHETVKSVSNEHTFGKDQSDNEYVRKTLAALCEKVAYRLRKQRLRGKTVHLKLRYDDFSTITRNKTLAKSTDQTDQIRKTVFELFDFNYERGRLIRLIGAGVSGFGKSDTGQISLFDERDKKLEALDSLEDAIKTRFGTHSIGRADSLGTVRHSDFGE